MKLVRRIPLTLKGLSGGVDPGLSGWYGQWPPEVSEFRLRVILNNRTYLIGGHIVWTQGTFNTLQLVLDVIQHWLVSVLKERDVSTD